MLNWQHKDITTHKDIDDMVTEYEKCTDIFAAAFDTESTGLHIIYDNPFLFQFGWCTSSHGWTYAVDIELYPEIAQRTITVWNILAKRAPMYAGHNIKYDLHMLINYGIPYTGSNITDTMYWIRLGCDAIPERKGGVSLKLKKFAASYISRDARNMEEKLIEERKSIASGLNLKLRQRLGWKKKQLEEFFDDKINDADDLPEDKKRAYQDWYDLDLPLYLKNKITGYVTKDDIPYNVLDRKTVTYYGHLDIVWTLETLFMMHHIVKVRGNLDAIQRENENIYPLLRMERVGFPIDFEYLQSCKENMKQYILQRREDFKILAGMDIKSSQNKVILQALNDFGVRTTTTRADGLDTIVSELKRTGENPVALDFIEILQELRSLEKWYSTYLIRYILNYRKEDGRMYTSINGAGTVSGRVTSDFQQFPKKGIKALDGTELFHPRKLVRLPKNSEYNKIVYLDYSQIELRFQAFYTILVGHPDTNLCRAYMPYKCHTWDDKLKINFNYKDQWCIKNSYNKVWYYDEEPDKKWEPLDVHGATTKAAFDIDENDPKYHELRYVGKTTNFAKNYGAQYAKIKTMFPEFSEEQVKRIDEAYYIAFPGVKEYHTYCYKMAAVNAYLTNMFGVRYYGASGHNLINMLVQGSAAYFLKDKFNKIDDYLQKHNYKSKIMMQIHDELQFLAHKDDPPELFFKIKELMEDWEESYVPIVADMEVTTTTWAEKYEVNSVKELKDAA